MASGLVRRVRNHRWASARFMGVLSGSSLSTAPSCLSARRCCSRDRWAVCVAGKHHRFVRSGKHTMHFGPSVIRAYFARVREAVYDCVPQSHSMRDKKRRGARVGMMGRERYGS